MSGEISEDEVEALARVLAPAHPDLHVGSAAPDDDPDKPTELAYSIARTFLARQVVNVEIDVEEVDE